MVTLLLYLLNRVEVDWSQFGPFAYVLAVAAAIGGGAKALTAWLDIRADQQAKKFEARIDQVRKESEAHISRLESRVSSLENGHKTSRMYIVEGIGMTAPGDEIRKVLFKALEALN